MPGLTGLTSNEARYLALVMYLDAGFDSSAAVSRIQANLKALDTHPDSYREIAQKDIAAITGKTVTAATTVLTAEQAVQQAFALYKQSGLDDNAALARVQVILPQLAATPANYAQLVQTDLAR